MEQLVQLVRLVRFLEALGGGGKGPVGTVLILYGTVGTVGPVCPVLGGPWGWGKRSGWYSFDFVWTGWYSWSGLSGFGGPLRMGEKVWLVQVV
jgi:hypothetical protein